MRHPWARPYVLTSGRTDTSRPLYLHTLVAAADLSDTAVVRRLSKEKQRLYEQARQSTQSVAELSAHCGLPLGVTRVLLGDLAERGYVIINPGAYASPFDQELLKRVLDGLRELA
jgi:hypothetical protein